MKRKYKSIFLTIIAIFLIGMGYFNLGVGKDSFDLAYTNNSEKSGDVELVNSDAVDDETKKGVEVFNEENNKDEYFSASRLERDKMYSQMVETYQNMIDSNMISSEQKSIAIEEINKIANYKNGILIAENLIKNKGLEDVVIFVNSDSISVIVRSNISLTNEQVAQIQNIVIRELNAKPENITISNK